MIGDTNVDIGQVLLGIAAILVAVPAVFATIASKRNSRKLDDLHDKTDTGNAKNLGTTVHDLAVSSQLIQAQLEANAQAAVLLAQKTELQASKAGMADLVDARVEFIVGAINAKLDAHILESRETQQRLIKALNKQPARGGEEDV